MELDKKPEGAKRLFVGCQLGLNLKFRARKAQGLTFIGSLVS